MAVKNRTASKGGSAQERRRARRALARKAHARVRSDAALTADATGDTGLPLSDRDVAWDAGAAAKTLSDAQLPKAFFWKDPDGDPKAKSTYKLGFASADGGTLTAIWKGVTAAAGAVQGARGGVQIPSGDVAGVKAKIGAYYKAAAKKYGDDQIKPPWEADDAKGQSAALLLAYAECDPSALDVFYADDGATMVGVGGSGDAIDGFLARRAHWDAELAPEPSPERALLDAVRDTLAMKGECANCGHLAIKHLGVENAGPCSECDCGGMVEADDDGVDETSSRTVAYVTISEEAQKAAVAALLEGFEVTADGPQAETVVETFRLRLDQFVTELQAEFDTVPLPAEHEPSDTVPARTPGAAAPAVTPPPTVGGQLRWRASLVPEATLTDDGRAFAPDSITWRELPLSLMAMINTSAEGGHDGALVAGRIDRIWRDSSGMIWGEGVFDEGDYGSEIGRMVGDGTLRGVSVDVAVQNYLVGPRSNWFDDDGNWSPSTDEAAREERDIIDVLLGEQEEPLVYVVTEGVIGAATVCPFQAFADAVIELAASICAAASPAVWTVTQQGQWLVVERPKVGEATGEPREGVEVALGETAVVTAAAAALAPVAPPASWFENPALDELTPLVVTPEGRVYGHAAAWDTCHIGIPDVCTVAPHSNAAYAYFLLKEVECDDGDRVSCGTITLETGHAGRSLGRQQAAAHYDDTGLAAADVVVGEDAYGIWVAGAVRPDMDAEKVRDLRGAVLSGDWRNVNGNLELVALLAVNVPGFPVPRGPRADVVLAGGALEVQSLTSAGVHNGPVEDGRFVSPDALAKIEALRLAADGRFARLAARARDAA